MGEPPTLTLPPHLVPERLARWERVGDHDLCDLLIPRFKHPLLARWMRPLMSRPDARLHLDEVGSFVWLRCDGDHTIGDILAEMRQEFGESVEPAEDRLGLFLRQLLKGQVLRLLEPAGAISRGEEDR